MPGLETSYLRGGVQGKKLLEHDFEITGGPNGPHRGRTFWASFEASDPKAPVWRPRPFSRQKGSKNRTF